MYKEAQRSRGLSLSNSTYNHIDKYSSYSCRMYLFSSTHLNVLKLSNLEVAEGDTGEASRLLGNGLVGETVHRLNSPHLKEASQKRVQDEEMADNVDHVQSLDEEIETSEEGSLSLVAQE